MESGVPTRQSGGGRKSPRLVRRKVSDEVIDYLMAELFNGHLRSGDRLDVAAIAASLGVSPSPVREALVVLERDGVLTTVYHRGVFVAPFTAESVLESFELFGALSGLAASKVARDSDPEVISMLETLVQEERKAASEEVVVQVHWEFRNVLHHHGASQRVRNLLRNFVGIIPASASILMVAETPRQRSADLQRMMRTIRAGDPDEAAGAAYDISARAGRRVVQALEERGVFEPRDSSRPPSVTMGADDRRSFMRLLSSS